ncbi:VOC family protein [Paenibacillus sp. GCM10023250]|uniref:VOC family protein n=1 Tax=Paenibacillus sp. GCM10023250 TaxID=3252648 RepID=UPI0036142817
MTYQATPFILLGGEAKAAIAFYARALNAEIAFTQTFGEGPADPGHPVPDAAKDRVAHAVLKLGGADLFVADAFPGTAGPDGGRVQVCLTVPDAETSRRFFDALAEGGRIVMPLGKIHFSPSYGVVTDRFGVTFQIFTSR